MDRDGSTTTEVVTAFGPYQATIVNIHDGDTISVDVLLRKQRVKFGTDEDLGFHVHRRLGGIWLTAQSVRLSGCNAAELATAQGQAAREFILTLVQPGDLVALISHGVDKYGGRIDGSVTLADGRDLTSVMIAAGQAAPWDGSGPKPVPAITG